MGDLVVGDPVVGISVGLLVVGAFDGLLVGANVGAFDGLLVGANVGAFDGLLVVLGLRDVGLIIVGV